MRTVHGSRRSNVMANLKGTASQTGELLRAVRGASRGCVVHELKRRTRARETFALRTSRTRDGAELNPLSRLVRFEHDALPTPCHQSLAHLDETHCTKLISE